MLFVVVLPFVPETKIIPCRDWRARKPVISGHIFSASIPGREEPLLFPHKRINPINNRATIIASKTFPLNINFL
ncbi:MAG TPA: hypothetical protein DHV84_01035 [Desulfotomaculum sp.]|nr:hypothetical protein [Desulfotomaculum sp.]